jgi:putative DNA primase/helicase
MSLFPTAFTTEPVQKDDKVGTARRYLKERFDHADHCRLIYAQETWYEWTGRAYVAREPAWMRAGLYAWLDRQWYYPPTARSAPTPYWPDKADVTNMVDAVAGICLTDATPPAWLGSAAGLPDPAKLLVGLDGILDLSDPDLPPLPNTPSLFAVNAIDYPVAAAAAECPTWLAFLADLWPTDVQSVELLQEWFGYCLTADTSAQKMLLMVGPKRSGKGTIARVLGKMLGLDNICAPTLSGLSTNFGLSALIGKRLGIIGDARLSGRSDIAVVTERLLSLSGEDAITIDRKNREALTVKLPTRLMICTNEVPRLADASGALSSRFLIVNLTRSFFGHEDPGLSERLYAEMPGILAWAVKGWTRYSARGRFAQPETAQQTLQELADLASPIQKFVDDWCEIKADAWINCQQLYAAFRMWCQDEGMRVSPMPYFSRDLQAAVPAVTTRQIRVDDGMRTRRFGGIRLQADAEMEVARRTAGRSPPDPQAGECPI